MNDFIVSAIKYRPATFQSVVGQPSITGTLKNAIAQKHLAHGYLFCGPRGVGKTTCARIFAKTLNCSNIQQGTEPCNECESCKAFNENRSYNIHELDAASNNKVDDIRQLIDQVRIPPQLGQYSIYIIDEVHMLSSAAFNAFLKTLEEPPKHAVFILATTEKHKIIPTILSRCQIFDFNRIRVEDIVKHLEYVAQQEGVSADPEALNVIALKADGAMRDALSIFDQIVSFSGNEVTYAKTIENLNVLDYDYYFKLVDAMLENRAMDALLLFNTILENGFEAQYFLNGLATHLRDLLVSASPQTLVLLEVGDSVKEKYQEQAKRCSADYLFKALEVITACDVGYRISRNKRLHVELALLKLCNLSKKKITELEQEPTIGEISNTATIVTAKQPAQQPKEPKVEVPNVEKQEQKHVEEKVEEKEKPQSKEDVKDVPEVGSKRKIPSISIRNLSSNTAAVSTPAKQEETKEKNISNNSSEELVLGEESFTLELATEGLERYVEEHKSEERLKITLTAYPLEVNGNEILIKVNNSLESALVDKNRAALEKYWQRFLNNKNVKIKLIEPKQEDRSIKSMGEKDKLKHLISKNETVLKLKRELGLEFE